MSCIKAVTIDIMSRKAQCVNLVELETFVGLADAIVAISILVCGL